MSGNRKFRSARLTGASGFGGSDRPQLQCGAKPQPCPIATGAFTENVFGADARPPIKMALFMFARVEKKSPNPVDKHVGRRVRMRRMMLAMSQEKLGNALGLTFQQVQKYEKGTNRIGASRLQQISHILQVPVAFFFEGAPNLHGSTDRMKDAPSPSYVSDFLATPRRALADKGFHADQRTQA
jgi:transcriptional regulator with XRE-family HTH domain